MPIGSGLLKSTYCLSALAVLIFCSTIFAAHPIVGSYERLQNKKRIQNFHAGRLLAEELSCVACHDPGALELNPKQALILTDVSGRAKAEHLRKFIANPQATKPGTSMPGLFHGKDAALRDSQVDALVHFLVSLGPGEPPQEYARFGANRRGDTLYHQVGCVGCHDPQDKNLKGSVPLGDLADKYTMASLAKYLQNPLHSRPSGRMPSLNLTSNEATDIAAYLLPNTPERAGMEYEYYEVRTQKVPKFAGLTPKDAGVAETFDISKHAKRGSDFALRYSGALNIDTAGEYKFTIGSDDGSLLWIDGKVAVNNDGVHGMTRKSATVELTEGRHSIEVEMFERDGGEELEAYFQGPGVPRTSLDSAMVSAAAPDAPLEDLKFAVNASLAAKGKQLFTSVGCASCHEAGEIKSTFTAPALAKLDVTKGCLATSQTEGAFYELNDKQRTALAKLVAGDVKKLNAKRSLEHTMLQFNCVACHERGKLGGVDVARNEYFSTTQQEMGVEGSIPPHLDGVGSKLTRAWLDKILANGAKDRPYMLTRMPKFGTDNVGHLGQALEDLDKIEALPQYELTSKQAKKAGHRMVGTRGFSCIKCHTFGRYKATGVQSIDMTIMAKRLREDWFRTYIKNPQVYRRGTRMPSAWPMKGPSQLPKLLEGDSDKQIAAVWRYLQDGARAKTPAGLSSSSMELIPGEEAIVYRNFIQGAGSRAIGVGYPEGLHLAFDANDLRVALIWQGPFIDAARHWNGRGQGYQPPAGNKVQTLASGVSIAELDSATAAWPTQGARELGYQFKGYRLSSEQRPTFLYQIHGLQVSDFCNPVDGDTKVTLGRSLSISGTPNANTFLRLAAGQISREGNVFDLGGGLKLTVANADELNATIRESDGSQELLIPLSNSKHEHIINLDYEW